MKLLLTLLFALSVHPAFSQVDGYLKSSGNQIHYTTFGEGEPMLIINGGPGMSSEGFVPLAEKLSASNQTILYDQRGTGKSKIRKVDSSTITLDSMVHDIEQLRKHLQVEQWVVLGHSFGGMLASYYTTKFPERVKGLILSSSGGIDLSLLSSINIRSGLTATEIDSLNYWTAQIADGDTSYHAQFQRGKYLAPAYVYNKAHINTIAHRLTQGNSTINSLVFQNMRAINFDCSEKLKTYTKPVLIIQGKQDILDKSIAEKAHQAFPNSRLVYLDKCRHYGWLDQPALYFAAIDRYLDTLESQ